MNLLRVRAALPALAVLAATLPALASEPQWTQTSGPVGAQTQPVSG